MIALRALGLVLTALVSAGERPDLTGRWQLNGSLSAGYAVVPEAQATPPPEVEPPGSFPRRIGSHPQGGSGDGELLSRARFAPLRVDIVETSLDVTIAEGDTKRHLYPDGRTVKEESAGRQVKSHWDKDQLIVETRGRDGLSLREIFELGADGRLVVRVRCHNPDWRDDLNTKRVYDRLP